MIQDTLKQFGLSENEVAIYLEALSLGKATPARIAASTGINRATVYTVAKVLVKKGLVAEDLGGKTTYLVPTPPRDLSILINREKRALENKEKLLSEAIRELETLPTSTQFALPTIKFVQDSAAREFMFAQRSKWVASSAKYDSTWWGFRDHTFAEQYQEWIDTMWKEEQNNPTGFSIKLLANPLDQSKIDKELNERKYPVCRQVLPWKGDTPFKSSTWVAGDYIVMCVTNERPFYIIEIYNPVLAEDLVKIFKEMWTQATKS